MLEGCRRGDQAAWDRFFDTHYVPVGRFLFQVVPDATPEDVEEVCQDTFLAAVRALDSFAGRSRLQTWLFRIAANKARDFRNRRLAAKRGAGRVPESLHGATTESGPAVDPPAPTDDPSEELARQEAMAEVRRGLDSMGNPCRELLELRYFGELDYEALGEVLGVNSKTVSSRLSRCLDKLGAVLAGVPGAEPLREGRA